jgi:hypothetical protein
VGSLQASADYAAALQATDRNLVEAEPMGQHLFAVLAEQG